MVTARLSLVALSAIFAITNAFSCVQITGYSSNLNGDWFEYEGSDIVLQKSGTLFMLYQYNSWYFQSTYNGGNIDFNNYIGHCSRGTIGDKLSCSLKSGTRYTAVRPVYATGCTASGTFETPAPTKSVTPSPVYSVSGAPSCMRLATNLNCAAGYYYRMDSQKDVDGDGRYYSAYKMSSSPCYSFSSQWFWLDFDPVLGGGRWMLTGNSADYVGANIIARSDAAPVMGYLSKYERLMHMYGSTGRYYTAQWVSCSSGSALQQTECPEMESLCVFVSGENYQFESVVDSESDCTYTHSEHFEMEHLIWWSYDDNSWLISVNTAERMNAIMLCDRADILDCTLSAWREYERPGNNYNESSELVEAGLSNVGVNDCWGSISVEVDDGNDNEEQENEEEDKGKSQGSSPYGWLAVFIVLLVAIIAGIVIYKARSNRLKRKQVAFDHADGFDEEDGNQATGDTQTLADHEEN